LNNYKLNAEGDIDSGVVKCCVPLTAICPQLYDMKEKAMFAGLGQFI